jgi:hypothetical protein
VGDHGRWTRAVLEDRPRKRVVGGRAGAGHAKLRGVSGLDEGVPRRRYLQREAVAHVPRTTSPRRGSGSFRTSLFSAIGGAPSRDYESGPPFG